MKKLSVLCFVLLILMIGSVTSSHASLIVQDSNYVLDDDSGLLWYRDLSYFSNKTYDEQITAISNLGEGLHMADTVEMTLLLEELTSGGLTAASLFTPSGSDDTYNETYYYGRFENSPDINKHRFTIWYSSVAGMPPSLRLNLFPLDSMFATPIDDSFTSNYYGAWAVRDAAPVPEPATVMLFGLGFLGLAGIKCKYILFS